MARIVGVGVVSEMLHAQKSAARWRTTGSAFTLAAPRRFK
jgi:hypothetical protein